MGATSTVKRHARLRPILTGGTLFLVVVTVSNIVVEESFIYGVARASFTGGAVAWITWLLYRNNTLKRDVLTGLYLRTIADEKLETLTRQRKDVTVAMLDINGLKGINDSMGHDAGDSLMKEIGRRLTSQFAFSRIIVARLGGDEFIVIAPHKSQQELCDELNACLSKPHLFGDWFVASVGVARSRTGYARDALSCADRAMYYAKKDRLDHALQYDCVLHGIPTTTTTRPQKRLRDERF